MSSRFASNKIALGICDNCGFQYRLKTLRNVTVRNRVTSLKFCRECWNPDQPQNKLGLYPVHDAQAIRDARPDNSLQQSRTIQYGFDPVGLPDPYGLYPSNLKMITSIGTITVTIS